MKTLKHWVLETHDQHQVSLRFDGKHTLRVYVLEQNLFRIVIKRDNQFRLDRTWTVSPDKHDTEWEGRSRDSVEGFTLPEFHLVHDENKITIATDTLRLVIHNPLWMEWQQQINGQWQSFAQDRKTGAFQISPQDNGVAHFMHRHDDEFYYGLGEKTGDLNRAGRRFEMRNLDAMGYDASKTDPLYKHIPFYITRRDTASYGLFYDNLASSWFDLGNELDNYHIKYRSYRAEDGDMDLYFMYGSKVLDITKAFVQLTGGTIFGPKWSLGYSGSTMQYTDAPNSQELLQGFVDQCAEQAIPCDSFQLSSGYTSIGNKRYVFNWNHDKVPSPEAMSDYFHQHGVKLAANIKPCMLHDHPRYEEARAQGLFIRDSETEEPEISVFWDADGSHLDFTNPDTVTWWQNNVKQQLLDKGIDATWNDNNEYEIWDRNARCAGFGREIPISLIRPLHSLLMMKASYEAQKQHAPTLRPYLISRSGCPGMNRYVQTWSGDNRTNWESLRYNIKMGLGMSLSGLYNIGHDVGGFAGGKPDPELFLRWVQNGVMHPRFTIHSWNDDGSVNEPWMYPEVTPAIRQAINLRYQLLPYLYNALWQAHSQHEPILRPTFLDHEADPQTFRECDDYLLGQDLLVASVVEPGQRQRQVYLPANERGWYDFYDQQWFCGGQTITMAAPLEKLPLLVRAGTVIPTSSRTAAVNKDQDNERQLAIFPLMGSGHSQTDIFDDDGESYGYQQEQYLHLAIQMTCTGQDINLQIQRTGQFQPAYTSLQLQLPESETRRLIINQKTYVSGDRLDIASL
ncbi:TIM-barrel domain-containing protein [Gynuella sp.]|uniref:glycoside hydrolase family 31 protein n=1 Tax=Gynuella sp. TaxID=2969146 RepID=UPI003D0C2950